MTIEQAIERVDAVKPNQYDDASKTEWLSNLDGRVFGELVLTHEDPPVETFAGYASDTPVDTQLLVPAPYADVYIAYLCAQIDFYNAEIDRYNNSSAMFNAAWADLAAWYNRTHMPKAQNTIRI